jgi:lysozyme
MIPTADQWINIALIKQVIASRHGFTWILPSYICAEVTIESGWDASSASATSSSLGLMQVEAATVQDVVAAYGLTGLGPQSDAYSSLLTGTCYFDLCARKIIAARGTKSLRLTEVAEAYNAGYGGFLAGNGNPRYGAKMLAQQIFWAPLVDSPAPVIPVPATTTSDVVIDLSHYDNVNQDFTTVAASGIVAVILKATQGVNFVDPTFLPRATAARAAGLLVGAYHFLDDSPPADQTAHFLTVASSEAGVNWLALDWEPYPAAQASAAVTSQVAVNIYALTGRWPILYTIRNMLSVPNATLSNCPLWLGEWGSNPILPPGFSAWKLWQHTDGQVGSDVVPVAGIGPCDRSRFAGSLAELASWWANPV